MNTAIQLKALIRNMAKQKNIDAQILLRNYMLERLLERIAASEFKNNFILKGGMLVSAIVGIDARSTVDMDATIKGWPVTSDTIQKMFENILSIQFDDIVKMKITSIMEIREADEYEGIRITIETEFDKIRQTLKVDITTGEDITPKEINYHFKLMFEDRNINIMAYNIETILSEKLETVISRSITNTRMRDFYDIYILSKLKKGEINNNLLNKAIVATTKKRGTYKLLSETEQILEQIELDDVMKDFWNRYKSKYSYAERIEWNEIMQAVKLMLSEFTRKL